MLLEDARAWMSASFFSRATSSAVPRRSQPAKSAAAVSPKETALVVRSSSSRTPRASSSSVLRVRRPSVPFAPCRRSRIPATRTRCSVSSARASSSARATRPRRPRRPRAAAATSWPRLASSSTSAAVAFSSSGLAQRRRAAPRARRAPARRLQEALLWACTARRSFSADTSDELVGVRLPARASSSAGRSRGAAGARGGVARSSVTSRVERAHLARPARAPRASARSSPPPAPRPCRRETRPPAWSDGAVERHDRDRRRSAAWTATPRPGRRPRARRRRGADEGLVLGGEAELVDQPGAHRGHRGDVRERAVRADHAERALRRRWRRDRAFAGRARRAARRRARGPSRPRPAGGSRGAPPARGRARAGPRCDRRRGPRARRPSS